MANIFDQIAGGNFIDENNEVVDVMTEAVDIDRVSFSYDKFVNKQVLLPQGKPIGRGNICFLYSHNMDESIELMTQKTNFIGKNYRQYYRNFYYNGKLYNRVFRIKEREKRLEQYELLKKESIKGIIRPDMVLNKNTYYDLYKYIEIFNNICGKLSVKLFVTHYWAFFSGILKDDLGMPSPRKTVLVDLTKFPIGGTLKKNLENPLYLIYWTMSRVQVALSYFKDLNVDFLFFNGRKFLVFNPSKHAEKANATEINRFKTEMMKMMRGISSDEMIKVASDESKMDQQEISTNAAADVISVLEPAEVAEPITTNDQLVKVTQVSDIEKKIIIDADKKTSAVMNAVDTVKKASEDKPEDKKQKINNKVNDQAADEVSTNIKKELEEERDKLKEIYNQTRRDLPKKSESSTARDKMLREEQKNIVVGNMTIAELNKIKADNIPVPVNDVSKAVDTINDNMKQIRFENLDNLYNDKVMKKDIVNAVLSLNDKSIPIFIRDVKVEDSSDELNYKDTYTIHLEDGNRKRHTIKIDIPKFIDGQILYLGGNKKLLKHQSFYLPVVKISPTMVQIVSNYSKMTLERKEAKATGGIERLKKIVVKNENCRKLFEIGNVYPNNGDYVTTIEYDQLSKSFISYKSGNTHIFFNQPDAQKYMDKHEIRDKENKLFIGVYKGENCFIDIDTQRDKNEKTIVDIIVDTLPKDISDEFMTTKSPNQLIFATVRVMNKPIAVGMLIGLWEGLTTLFKKMKLDYRLEDKVPKQLQPNEDFLKFKDCVLVYKTDIPTDLIMNGFKKVNTGQYNIIEMDEKYPYVEYMKSKYGQANIENALMNFYEFMIDNITLEIIMQLDLPRDIVSLMIYAIKLLADSRFVPEINQNLSRIRCGEVVPAILYSKIAKAYVDYRNSNGRKKYSIPQNAVIKDLLSLGTVEDYSILNPTLEMDQKHAVSSKGFNGVNLDDSYTIPRRSYDPSMIGIISPSTSPDGQCGIARHLSLEPNITNLRGFTEDKWERQDELKDVNVFCPSELTMPLAASVDDPSRLGHAQKQSSHVIPVKKSSPVLISNGVEDVVRFHVSKSFAINAEEDGEIVDYDENSKIMIARYKSGKCQAIDLNPQIVKNSGGGFYLSNKLATTFKVGDKFKKNECLAYHKDYFTNSRYNNARMNMGPLVKVALMSTYNTYEDGTMITEKFSEDASTEMVFSKDAVIGKNSNVFYMVKKGQEVSVGDPLIRFDTSYEDETVNSLLAGLSQTEKDNILESARNEIKSKYSGVIEDIKIYSTVDLDEMNPSLRKIVSAYYKEINQKKAFLEKYDNSENPSAIMKCGIMVTDASHKVKPDRYGNIRGNKVEDSVLIQFYIKHGEPLEVGSKIANFSALKNTVGEICPKGYEPYSEFRPDEEIGTCIASNSILNRMVPSIFLLTLGNKCIIELKRSLKELNMDRAKMEALIYKFFTAFDKTGANTKRYKELFQPMSDTQFKSYFKGFFEDEDAYLILSVVDYERTIRMEDIERAAKVINIPLFEYVYLPHLSMDKKHVVVTPERVPVGYINEKRTQQTVELISVILLSLEKYSFQGCL